MKYLIKNFIYEISTEIRLLKKVSDPGNYSFSSFGLTTTYRQISVSFKIIQPKAPLGLQM